MKVVFWSRFICLQRLKSNNEKNANQEADSKLHAQKLNDKLEALENQLLDKEGFIKDLMEENQSLKLKVNNMVDDQVKIEQQFTEWEKTFELDRQ